MYSSPGTGPLALIAIFIFIVYYLYWEIKGEKLKEVMPDKEIPNDKIVLVKNITHDLISEILTEICDSSIDDSPIRARLITRGMNEFMIVFPYDVSFLHLCFIVNQFGIRKTKELHPDVTAWATEDLIREGTEEKIENKKIMVFNFDDDEDQYEDEAVYITTADNFGCRIFGDLVQSELAEPIREYVPPPTFDSGSLFGKQIEDFE